MIGAATNAASFGLWPNTRNGGGAAPSTAGFALWANTRNGDGVGT